MTPSWEGWLAHWMPESESKRILAHYSSGAIRQNSLGISIKSYTSKRSTSADGEASLESSSLEEDLGIFVDHKLSESAGEISKPPCGRGAYHVPFGALGQNHKE